MFKSFIRLSLVAFAIPLLSFGDVEWLYNGSNLITEQNVESGSRGWILKVSANGNGFLQCTGIQQSGTNVAGSVTSRRFLDMDAPIKNAAGAEFKINKLANSLFYKNTAIDTVRLPSSITVLSDSLFREAPNLKQVYMDSRKIKEVGSYPFYGCIALTNISTLVFDEVTLIRENAFCACNNLVADIVINNDKVTLMGGIFRQCPKIKSFTINGDYKGNIPSSMFYGCKALTYVQFSTSEVSRATSIGECAFYNCSALATVKPFVFDRLTSIGKWAFESCKNLKGDFVNTYNGNVSIGSSTFSDSKVTSVRFDGHITSIGKYFCRGDPSLTNVYFASTSSTMDVGESFIYGCSGLKTLHMPSHPKSFGKLSFAALNNRQMVIYSHKYDNGVGGWLGVGKYTPWKSLSAADKNSWLNLADKTKEARGWPVNKNPAGVTLGASIVSSTPQWIVTIPFHGLVFEVE